MFDRSLAEVAPHTRQLKRSLGKRLLSYKTGGGGGGVNLWADRSSLSRSCAVCLIYDDGACCVSELLAAISEPPQSPNRAGVDITLL